MPSVLMEIAHVHAGIGRPAARLARLIRDAVPGAVLRVGRGSTREVDAGLALTLHDREGEALGVLAGPESAGESLRQLAPLVAAKLSDARDLTALRGQAAQLSQLNAAAHAVSADLDLDRVLAAVCSRARTLTGAELAYIMLTDEARSDCYVRASDGVRTDAFRRARLALGDGLGGLVAKENQPYYASDYLQDARFAHVVDDVVSAEGLVSVMAVPLAIGHDVIGVLFAAYRRHTRFDEADVRVLESLADHAAIALANAHLHQQTKAALARESELRAIADERRQRLEWLNTLHTQLSEVMLAEHSTDGMLAAISAALGRGVILTEHPPDDTAAAVPVAAGRQRFGWLAMSPSPAVDADLQALEQAARVVAVHLLRERAVAHEQFRVRSEFLDRLLAADSSGHKDVLRTAQQLGLDLDGPLVAVFVRPTVECELVDVVSRINDRLSCGALVVARAQGVVVVVCAARARDLIGVVAPACAPVPVHMGLSAEITDIASLGAAIDASQRVADAASAANLPTGTASTEDELGVYPALVGDAELARYAVRILEPLARQGRDLLETLEVYLRTGMSSTESARQLTVHVNTLYYRLRRIRELTGYDLDDPETRFELDLAVRLVRAQRLGRGQ